MPPRNATGLTYQQTFTTGPTTWLYPFVPGEPQRQVTSDQVVCITSEPYLTGSICRQPEVDGELIYAPDGAKGYLTTENATSVGVSPEGATWYWCLLDFQPFDTTINRTVVPAGDGVGPAAITAWEEQFNRLTSREERDRLDVVFGCRYSKAVEGGGVRRYFSAAAVDDGSPGNAASGNSNVALGTGYLLLVFWLLMQSWM